MNKCDGDVCEIVEKATTFEVDIEEGWPKVIERQFGGPPSRAFGELLQNAIDSYPADTPFEERMLTISGNDNRIALTDYGEGLGRERLLLLVTLGGTDKRNDAGKIGRFGIGFFSIFNPALGTRRVCVTTRCEDRTVEVTFKVERPGGLPRIETRILEERIAFSTRVEVTFDQNDSVAACIRQARQSLEYYPCRVSIDGTPFGNAWELARAHNYPRFKEGSIDGLLRPTGWGGQVTVLCKYERILTTSLDHLLSNQSAPRFDLSSHRRKKVPYLDGVEIVVNCNDLNVTISRDSFWLDTQYGRMVRDLATVLMAALGQRLIKNPTEDLVLANQYVLSEAVAETVQSLHQGTAIEETPTHRTLVLLAEAKVYRVNGRADLFSLVDLYRMRTPDLPLYYSVHRRNLRWLGGAFKHDFIVLPEPCDLGGGAPGFYARLFKDVFEDVFDLDVDTEDSVRIRELVQKGVVDPKDLTPRCALVGERDLTEEERLLLRQLSALLAKRGVLEALGRAVHLRPRSILPVFFDVEGEKAVLATGLFTSRGEPLSDLPANLRAEGSQDDTYVSAEGQDLLLGLRRDHPMIEQLMTSRNPYRVYFAIMFMAHELALCQKVLAPYSAFYHLTKERLAGEMRKALTMDFAKTGTEESAEKDDAHDARG